MLNELLGSTLVFLSCGFLAACSGIPSTRQISPSVDVASGQSRTFLVPTRLRLTRDHKVVFLRQDAQRVKVITTNGLIVGTRILCSNENDIVSEFLQSRALTPSQPDTIDDWRLNDPRGPADQVTYSIEVFETARRPEHMWDPAPGVDDYKMLWRKTFTVSGNGSRK